jgi:hypothetical protein
MQHPANYRKLLLMIGQAYVSYICLSICIVHLLSHVQHQLCKLALVSSRACMPNAQGGRNMLTRMSIQECCSHTLVVTQCLPFRTGHWPTHKLLDYTEQGFQHKCVYMFMEAPAGVQHRHSADIPAAVSLSCMHYYMNHLPHAVGLLTVCKLWGRCSSGMISHTQGPQLGLQAWPTHGYTTR